MAPDRLRLQLSGDLRMPPGNIVIRPPLDRPLQSVRVNGKPIQSFSADEAMISEFPANVVLDSAPAPPPVANAAPEATPPPEPATKTTGGGSNVGPARAGLPVQAEPPRRGCRGQSVRPSSSNR